MPKTAICFSGELRSIDVTLPLLEKNVFSRFSDYDIFCFTWTDDPDIAKIQHLIRTGKVKDIELQPRKSFDVDKFFPKKPIKTNYETIIRQLYCVKRANSIKTTYAIDNKINYDIVVRVRPDLLVLNDTFLPEDFEKRDFNYIHLLDHDNWHGSCDRFYVSNNKNMDIISTRMDYLNYYSRSGGSQQHEAFLKFTTVWCEIEEKRIEGLKTCLLRTDGTKEGEIISVEKGEIEMREDGIYHLITQAYI